MWHTAKGRFLRKDPLNTGVSLIRTHIFIFWDKHMFRAELQPVACLVELCCIPDYFIDLMLLNSYWYQECFIKLLLLLLLVIDED